MQAMDQHAFAFATRGHCIKGKQCQHITVKNQNMSLGSKQSSLFYFYALLSGGKLKGAVVHYALFLIWSMQHIACLPKITTHQHFWSNLQFGSCLKIFLLFWSNHKMN